MRLQIFRYQTSMAMHRCRFTAQQALSETIRQLIYCLGQLERYVGGNDFGLCVSHGVINFQQ